MNSGSKLSGPVSGAVRFEPISVMFDRWGTDSDRRIYPRIGSDFDDGACLLALLSAAPVLARVVAAGVEVVV
ncbi:hypothetical protein SUGI_1489660 [Cryptomeria japonica]|uniref:Uncharacterized protein n=1 Tax=Cryptomeria japonica TaxID=3369 RepID=A0AAD3NU22_CRYJA|nr:hypothetical protein SUGI_1487870 [Cryptomeria japonica]GLJ59042.1 hypothetical protein SUGI_1489660 [Cryptomeria japonica]